MRHTRELEKKRNLDPLLMLLQLQVTITLFLSLVFGLNYKLKNRDTTSQYYLTKNLNPKNKEKNLN